MTRYATQILVSHVFSILMNIQPSLTLEHFRYLSSKQDGYPNSDVQPKGGSNLLGVYATVHKP